MLSLQHTNKHNNNNKGTNKLFLVVILIDAISTTQHTVVDSKLSKIDSALNIILN